MIFISHNHRDKPIVEQFALRLRDIVGQDKVFYDSWSMQPGDGLIDKMNEGLAVCKLFLFFVSKNSLQSDMVKLEWQNAVMKHASGDIKLIPIKLDDCLMPPILLQSLYIDLFGKGLEVSLRQIVDVLEGKNTYSKGPQEFSNLRAYCYAEGNSFIVEVHAEHFLEPISSFLYLTNLEENEISFTYKSGNMCNAGFNKNITLANGDMCNAQLMAAEKGTVPGFPFVVEVSAKSEKRPILNGVLHEKKQGEWMPIPFIPSRRSSGI